MKCIKCGEEVEDYVEGSVPICLKCWKVNWAKIRYIALESPESESGLKTEEQ